MSELSGDAIAQEAGQGDHSVPSCREILREATREPHERLHLHDGFARVKAGTITHTDYRALLIRLYGFILPFERLVGGDPIRTGWLERDLAALGVAHTTLARLALCADFPSYRTTEHRLGGLYVLEGAALGGRQLHRGLDALFGAEEIEGRRYFAGRGAGTGEAWLEFLERLETMACLPMRRAALIGAAVETFALFETWLGDWSKRT